MITVHHLERSRSHRVLWLLEELGVPYEIVRYQRDPKTMLAPPALREIHPLGKSPVITDGGVTVAESGAILEHLVERHGGGKLAPKSGTPEHDRYRYYMHYAEGSLMPPLLVKLITTRVRSAKMPFFARPIAKKIAGTIDKGFVEPNLKRHLAFLEHELEGRTWFAGDELTAADVQMSYPLEALVSRSGETAKPNVTRVLDAMRARPAYARAIEKGGPVMI
jgi:glutathione S-transferase